VHKFQGLAGKSGNLFGYEKEVDGWDRVGIVRYPSRRNYFQFLASSGYSSIMPYKTATAKLVLTPMDGAISVPDLRYVFGGVCLVLFLIVGWVRSARRGRA